MAELFHALNRGVDGRKIFMDDRDRARFVHDMWEFNDVKFVENIRRRTSVMTDIVSPSLKDRLVDIHGWCLMGNHYHLLLSETVESGLSRFLRKLNVGYARYFNERHRRHGTLFQSRTKKVRISTDAHFLHILHYIHLNPLDTLSQAKNWRSLKVRDVAACITHLQKYRWSSLADYSGKRNFPSILTTELFKDVFADYEKTLYRYLKELDDTAHTSYDLE